MKCLYVVVESSNNVQCYEIRVKVHSHYSYTFDHIF